MCCKKVENDDDHDNICYIIIATAIIVAFFTMPAINKASRAPLSPRSRKKRSNGAQLLTNITMMVLVLIVLHMTFSEGDDGPAQQSRSVGKTTNGKKKEADDLSIKVASYRKPEHEKDVAGLASVEKAFFNHDDYASSESEDDEDEDEADNMAPVDPAEDQMWIDPEEKKKFPKDVNTASEDLAENIQFLKATVAATLEHLRNEAYGQTSVEMQEVKEKAEEFKDVLHETTRRVLDVLVGDNNRNDEIRTKAEDVVFDRLLFRLQDQFEEQVILWITDISDDLDVRVAEWEDQGMDVNEIEFELTKVEEDEKLLEMEGEIDRITIDVMGQISYAIPTVCKDTLEGVLEFLGQHAELVFDDEDNLDLDTPLPNGVTFKDEQLLEAIEDARKGAGNMGDNDDIVPSIKAFGSKKDTPKDENTIAEDLDSNLDKENMGNEAGTKDVPEVSTLLIHDNNTTAAKSVGESTGSTMTQTESNIGSPKNSVNGTVVETTEDQEAEEVAVEIDSPADNATATHTGRSMQRKSIMENNKGGSGSNITVTTMPGNFSGKAEAD